MTGCEYLLDRRLVRRYTRRVLQTVSMNVTICDESYTMAYPQWSLDQYCGLAAHWVIWNWIPFHKAGHLLRTGVVTDCEYLLVRRLVRRYTRHVLQTVSIKRNDMWRVVYDGISSLESRSILNLEFNSISQCWSSTAYGRSDRIVSTCRYGGLYNATKMIS